MAQRRKYSLLVAALLSAIAVIASSTETKDFNPAGRWITQADKYQQDQRIFEFEDRHGQWFGYTYSAFGTVELRRVQVKGNKIYFDFNADVESRTRVLAPIAFEGTLEGDNLNLVVTAPTSVEKKRVAHRASPVEFARFRSTVLDSKLSIMPTLPDNGLARVPPMGWNSWNKFGLAVNDRLIREIADAMVSSGLRDLGYVYVNIDDGWQGGRDANGVLQPNNNFPNMKALGDYLHSRGLRFGIYSSPGTKTCDDFDGSYGHEEQDAKTFSEWGIDYLKYDWCSADLNYDSSMEMQAAYRKMALALRGTGRPIVFAICEYGLFDVGRWARAVGGNLWRTTTDIEDNWGTMASIGFDQSSEDLHVGPGGWSDSDMLEIGNGGMSIDEYTTQMTLWSMLSAPLLLGNDVRNIPTEIKNILTNKEVIAIDQDSLGQPAREVDSLGQQVRRIQKRGKIEIWTKPLSDDSMAIALFNRSNVTDSIEVSWASLGLARVSSARDLWLHKDLKLTDPGSYSASLPPHGSILLRVRGEHFEM